MQIMNVRTQIAYLFIVSAVAAAGMGPRPAAAQSAGFIQDGGATSNRLVSRKEFAENLIRKMGFEEPGKDNSTDPLQFLRGSSSINIQPANYKYAAPNIREGTTLVGTQKKSFLFARSAAAPVTYEFTTTRPGDVDISAWVKGGSQVWSVDGQAPVPVRNTEGAESTDAPTMKMKAGTHTLRITLPPGGSIGDIRVDTPCMSPILPVSDDSPNAPLTYGEKTAAMVRALDLAGGLPNQGEPLAGAPAASALMNPGAAKPVSASGEQGQALQGVSLNRTGMAGDTGKLKFKITSPQSGLFQIEAKVSGTGKANWSVNGCRASSTPVRSPDNSPTTVVVGTVELKKGENRVSVMTGPNLKFFGIQLKRKQEDTKSYYQVASAAGLQEGPPNTPVDQGGLSANLRNAAFVERMDALRQADRDELSNQQTGLDTLKNDAPGLGNFNLDNPGNFDTAVSPFVPLTLP